MKITRIDSEGDRRLVVAGALCHEYSQAMEELILDIMRCPSDLKVDLSGVTEVDLCGSHFIRFLYQQVQDALLTIVATSTSIDQTVTGLSFPFKSASLSIARKKALSQPQMPSADREAARQSEPAPRGTPLPRSIGISALYSCRDRGTHL